MTDHPILNTTCGFLGNSDVYGVGIRIGYYTQAMAVWFANFFLLSEAAGLRAVNNLFLFAMLVVALIYAFNARSTYAVEAFLLLQVGLCLGFVSIMQSTRYSTRYLRISGERLIVRTIVINAWMLLHVCFWWAGLDAMLKTPCGTHACYLVETNLYGWMRVMMKVLSLALLSWRAIGSTTQDIERGIRNIRMRSARTTFIDSAAGSPQDQDYRSVKAKETKTPVGKDIGNQERRKLSERPLKAATFVHGEAAVPDSVDACRRFTWPGSEGVHRCCATASVEGEVDGPLSSKGLTSEPAIPSQRRTSSDYAYFERVYEAEKYLENVFSVYPPTVSKSTNKFPICLLGGRLRICIPELESKCDPQSSSYNDCLRRAVTAAWTGCPPLYLRICLSMHITALQQHPIWSWPRFVDRMAQLNKTTEPPDWRTLTIASDISLSQMPLIISARIWTIMAAETLAIIMVLITQVELTIAWNSISGLGGLSTLGQLIPFILGVGGLLKVLWQKWDLVRRGIREEGKEEEYTSPYEKAIKTYLLWKKDQQKQPSLSASAV